MTASSEPRENHLPWQGTTGALQPAGRGQRDPWSAPARHSSASITGPDSRYQNTSLSHGCEPANRNSCCNFGSFPGTSSCAVTVAPAAPPAPPSQRAPDEDQGLLTHVSPTKPSGRAARRPLARPAPPEEPGTPSSSHWHPSHCPLSPVSDMGTTARGERVWLHRWHFPGPLSVCPQQQPQLLATESTALPARNLEKVALSRQVPINGVFYLTGEIKSLYREVQKS